jgi:periplasmic protein TonB
VKLAALRDLNTLHWALLASVVVHAALLTTRFVDPEGFRRVFEDTPLEVILVNTRRQDVVDKPQAIAQSALAGGGDAEQGRAATPLPSMALEARGDSAEDAQRRVEALQMQQSLLLAQLKQQLVALSPADERQGPQTPDARANEDKRRHLSKLIGEIERRINDQNARPRKRYISPATREAVYAVYYERLRRRIEERGTANFPTAAGRKMYGELTMIVTVHHDGRVVDTEVVESSGNTLLDRRAEAIARGSGPFGGFDAPMRREADQIAVVSRFKFTRDDTLETRLSNR